MGNYRPFGIRATGNVFAFTYLSTYFFIQQNRRLVLDDLWHEEFDTVETRGGDGGWGEGERGAGSAGFGK